MTRKVQIIGGSFLEFSKSASLREDNKDVHPTYFEWDETPRQGFEVEEKSPLFYCDAGLRKCTGQFEGTKVGWLLEPRHLHPENYEYAEKHHDKFDVILTYDKELLDACENARFYPLGGSSISFDKWGIYPKTKDVCMFVSSKNSTEGHKLRHEIVKKFKGRIDCYGAGVNRTVPSKFEILKDYRYCVVIESGFVPDYFSEKPIDVFCVGTILIYLGFLPRELDSGCVNLKSWGDLETTARRIEYFIQGIDPFGFPIKEDFEDPMFIENIEEAKQYRICEDWIYKNYEDIFSG